MSTVLVTGARGFIGRNTIPALLDAGFTVHAVGRRPFPVPRGVTVHTADLLDSAATSQLLDKVRPTHLVHLAWYVDHANYWNSFENLRWIDASLELLRSFCRHGGERCLWAGSCAEYDWTAAAPLSEHSTPLRPSTLYGAAKHSLQTIGAVLARSLGVSTAWCRLFFVYGPHEKAERLVPSLARDLLRGRPAVCRTGSLVRDFLHAGDAGRALAAILTSSHEGAVNVCSGEPVRIGELARLVSCAAGHPEALTVEEAVPDGEPESLVGDSALLRSLGFQAQYSLDAGVEATVEWWRKRLRDTR